MRRPMECAPEQRKRRARSGKTRARCPPPIAVAARRDRAATPTIASPSCRQAVFPANPAVSASGRLLAPRRGAAPAPGGTRRARALQALAQRIHQVDDVGRLRLLLGHLDRAALGLASHQRLEGVLVFVLELPGVEAARLAVEDVLGELDGVAPGQVPAVPGRASEDEWLSATHDSLFTAHRQAAGTARTALRMTLGCWS